MKSLVRARSASAPSMRSLWILLSVAAAAVPGCKAGGSSSETASTPANNSTSTSASPAPVATGAAHSPSPSPAPSASPSPGAPTYNVGVSWTANHERAVNATGGGYRVYYATTPGFAVASAASVNAPYVSGSLAPTSATLNGLAAGTYYVKVVAYSALVPPGGSSGAQSQPSAEMTVTVP